jgi:hypothetical protein
LMIVAKIVFVQVPLQVLSLGRVVYAHDLTQRGRVVSASVLW